MVELNIVGGSRSLTIKPLPADFTFLDLKKALEAKWPTWCVDHQRIYMLRCERKDDSAIISSCIPDGKKSVKVMVRFTKEHYNNKKSKPKQSPQPTSQAPPTNKEMIVLEGEGDGRVEVKQGSDRYVVPINSEVATVREVKQALEAGGLGDAKHMIILSKGKRLADSAPAGGIRSCMLTFTASRHDQLNGKAFLSEASERTLRLSSELRTLWQASQKNAMSKDEVAVRKCRIRAELAALEQSLRGVTIAKQDEVRRTDILNDVEGILESM